MTKAIHERNLPPYEPQISRTFFFFFGSVKAENILNETSSKLSKSTQEEYKKGEYLHPHLYPIQVKKSTKELKLSSLNNLAQDHKVNKKDDFILKVEGISFSKAALFLSFHSVQNKQIGGANQILFRFFPTLAPCQARRA